MFAIGEVELALLDVVKDLAGSCLTGLGHLLKSHETWEKVGTASIKCHAHRHSSLDLRRQHMAEHNGNISLHKMNIAMPGKTGYKSKKYISKYLVFSFPYIGQILLK